MLPRLTIYTSWKVPVGGSQSWFSGELVLISGEQLTTATISTGEVHRNISWSLRLTRFYLLQQRACMRLKRLHPRSEPEKSRWIEVESTCFVQFLGLSYWHTSRTMKGLLTRREASKATATPPANGAKVYDGQLRDAKPESCHQPRGCRA